MNKEEIEKLVDEFKYNDFMERTGVGVLANKDFIFRENPFPQLKGYYKDKVNEELTGAVLEYFKREEAYEYINEEINDFIKSFEKKLTKKLEKMKVNK